MALVKQEIDINFAKGLDLKTDPYQVAVGNFLRLQNSIFDKAGRLTKRNGFGQITNLLQSASFLTTFNGNLTAIGSTLQAYSMGSNTWVNKGNLQPISLSTLPLIRTNTNQTQVDVAVSPNNLVCTVYTDVGPSSTQYKYTLADSNTGQNILIPAPIPSSGTIIYSPRVFYLGNYFMIVSATNNKLEYVVINSQNPVAPLSSTTITTQISPSAGLNWDGVVANNNLYLAWNGSDGGGAIRSTFIDSHLNGHSTQVTPGFSATLMSVTADESGNTPNIYINWWTSTGNNGYTEILNQNLGVVLTPTQIITATAITNITGVANAGLQTVFYEIPHNYSYDASIPSHFIQSVTITVTGTVGTPGVVARSVGLASKAFMIDGVIYFLAVYQSVFQPTYFLLNSLGQVISRLAYSNAGGYRTTGLGNVTINGESVTIGYQFKDLIEAVNKSQGNVSPAGVYSQTGLNAVTFTLGTAPIFSEIGSTLNLTGGFLWNYDGYVPVENNFFVWPDNVEVTTSTTGGNLADQQYFYQVIYEWTDNQGNAQRSANSIPVGQVTAGGGTSSNTINIPTYRLTYKIANPVKIVVFRWSTGQQEYFQVTSITQPLLNDTTIDSVSFVDTLADSAIVGNSLIYTTGGVVENIGAPSFNSLTLFDSRLWGIDAEDPNLLWYSKQVIEGVPVEMSDLFTLFTAPTTGAQGSTGLTKCLAPMDDKLILFKRDAIGYINGTGPDNVGTNSQYSQPTFITATVGSENQQSIVISPAGLMFQSDKGIWLLDRSLNTSYIGAPVEDFTLTAKVLSAINVPETNQIRFTLDSGVTLMYDYFYQQWGTFVGIPAISSTIYQNLHTYINNLGQIFQETPGKYLDGSNPVLQSFSTAWIKSAGLIGFQRAYFLHLLGTYLSPHTLSVGLAYDYDGNKVQLTTIVPDNGNLAWGGSSPWGGDGVWGGATNIELERLFFEQQKCISFQVIVDEIYDSSFGTAAGAGLTLSGLNLTIGVKKGYPTLSASKSF